MNTKPTTTYKKVTVTRKVLDDETELEDIFAGTAASSAATRIPQLRCLDSLSRPYATGVQGKQGHGLERHTP